MDNPKHELSWRIIIWITGILTIAPFLRPLLDWDSALLYRDLSNILLPAKTYWANYMKEFLQIPLWDHTLNGGAPFWADLTFSSLFPLNFIFLGFAPENYPNAIAFYLALHYPLIFAGAYCLLRTSSLERISALFFALTYSLSGPVLSAHTSMGIIGSLIALPWYFHFWLQFLQKKKIALLVGASFFLALPILSGDPQISYILTLLTFTHIIYLCLSKRFWAGKLWFAFFLIGFFALLASAAQLLPALELVWQSTHTNLPKELAMHSSTHPFRLLEYIFPAITGNSLEQKSYWILPYLNGQFHPMIFSTYLGGLTIVTLLTLPAAFLLKLIPLRTLPWKYVFLSFFFLILSMGIFSPINLYEIFYDFLPLWDGFRYPDRLSIWSAGAFIWFIALVFQKIITLPQLQKLVGMKLFCLPFVFATLGIIASFLYPTHIDYPEQSDSIRASLQHFGIIILILSSLLMLILQQTLQRKLGFILIFLVTFCDLWMHGNHYIWTTPKIITKLESHGPTYGIIVESMSGLRKSKLQAGAARRFANVHESIFNQKEFFAANTFLSIGDSKNLLNWANMLTNITSYFQIENITINSALRSANKMRFLRESSRKRFMNITGVYYSLHKRSDGSFTILGLENSLPYVFLAKETQLKDLSANGITIVNEPNFDFQKISLIQYTGEKELFAVSTAPEYKLAIISRKGGSILFEIKSLADWDNAVLVWNESFNSHWFATVNNKPVPLALANAWAMGIPLGTITANETIHVKFQYKNPLIYYGLCLMGIWFLILFSALVFRRKDHLF